MVEVPPPSHRQRDQQENKKATLQFCSLQWLGKAGGLFSCSVAN